MANSERRPSAELTTLTQVTVLIIIPVLLAAGVILFCFPGDTDTLWAWTIQSQMTAMAIGGGYLAGAAFLAWSWYVRTWADLVVGLVGAWLLTALLLGATILHWDRFHHSNVTFWVWTGVYAITPVLLPVVILTNQRHVRSLPDRPSPRVPRAVRAAATLAGVAQAAVAVIMYARPSALMDHWPWPLNPLTARVIASFLAFIAIVWLAFAVTDRWLALRRPVAGAALGLAVVAVGALRASEEFRPMSQRPTIAFVVLLAGALAGLAALGGWMARRT
jgi:hypothetical protein